MGPPAAVKGRICNQGRCAVGLADAGIYRTVPVTETLPIPELPAAIERPEPGTTCGFWLSTTETVPLVYVETRVRRKAADETKLEMPVVVDVVVGAGFAATAEITGSVT